MPFLAATNHDMPLRLRATREVLGLSVSQLCAQARIGRSTWSNWVAGRNRPNLDEAIKLVETFDLSLDWIYRGSLAGVPQEMAARLRAVLLRLRGTSRD